MYFEAAFVDKYNINENPKELQFFITRFTFKDNDATEEC